MASSGIVQRAPFKKERYCILSRGQIYSKSSSFLAVLFFPGVVHSELAYVHVHITAVVRKYHEVVSGVLIKFIVAGYQT